MSLQLTIDEGNSSTKIGLWDGDELLREHTCKSGHLEELASLTGVSEPVEEAIFCSVLGRHEPEVRAALGSMARKLLVLNASLPLPVKLEYKTPGTLGADRIAAAAGARLVAPGCDVLVVDMGTAITYDVVTADGVFVGGNIAPGIWVRLEAMQHFTHALPLVETDGPTPRWGYDTETALRSGAVRGVIGELQYYRHCLLQQHSRMPAVIITGGSADLIIPYITTPILVEPNLVLKGLHSILRYNRILQYNEK